MAEGEKQHAPRLLHTGDLVLLKTQLKELELYAEAGETTGDTGYVNTDGLRGDLRIIPVDTLHSSGLDVREFLFVVVNQLNYIAEKDLARYRKQLRLEGGAPSSSALAKLKTYEDRARHEEQQNQEKMQSPPRPVLYGDIIQLQHLRTKRFIRIHAKSQAALQKTSRRCDIATGSASSWIRVNPFFKHKAQGVPVALNEQVVLESMKLGNHWSVNWAKCKNMAKEDVYEINCARYGRGFYIELYSRSVAQQAKVLSCPSPLRLVNVHHSGFVSASASKSKPLAYLRRGPLGDRNKCAKDVWVIEPGLPDRGDIGLEWHVTPVLLRHFGSGRYLSISTAGLEKALSGSLMDIPIPGTSPKPTSPSRRGGRRGGPVSFVGKDWGAPITVQAELVEDPGPASWFRLEPADLHSISPGMTMIPRGGYMLLRWDSSNGEVCFWLSCQGTQKGKRRSLNLVFTSARYSRDAIRIDVLDDPIDVMDDSDWLYECDVIAEHKKFLRKAITPRCADFEDNDVAAMVCSQCEHVLSDMIFFLAGSPHWRSTEVQHAEIDALSEPWTAKPERQRMALELKYIDATFDLFHEFVQHTQSLVDGDVRWGRRAVMLNLSMQVRPGEIGDSQGDVQKWRQLMRNTIACMKTRCLKLLVRLWLGTFLNQRKIEMYFLKNGWVETINNLNGHGLGASDVFVALLSNNKELVRQVDRTTVQKFIDFIRILGPLDTWLSFLVALCAPAESAVGRMQQLVLESLFFAGPRASPEMQQATEKNRKELLVHVRLVEGRSLGIPLGTSLGSAPPPLEQCLGRSVLVEGLMDIAVTWAHPPQWVVGRGVLYHGPQALGLTPIEVGNDDSRVFVSLADVVWVLQPERCCEPVTGMKWKDVEAQDRGAELGDGDVFSTDLAARLTNTHGGGSRAAIVAGRLERLKTLAKYFLAQLQVISDLVKERQMNCILALQEEYTFDLCICGSSDPRLPTSIRAAFFDILTDLWLDRHPHMQVVVPQLMRFLGAEEALDQLPVFNLQKPDMPDAWSQEHLDVMPLEVLSFYRFGKPHKMEAVIRVVRHFLSSGPQVEQQVHSDTDYNMLLLALLRILQKLLRFGFIHSVELLREIIGPLMRCLDGRTDLLQPLKSQEAGKGYGEGDVQLDVEPNTPLLQGLRGGYASPTSSAPPPGRLQACRFPPVEDGADRWEANHENTPVMECKVLMLTMALHTVQLGLHTKMTQVLSIFRQHVLNTELAQSAAAFGTSLVLPNGVMEKFLRLIDDPAITLSYPGIRNPAAMCVDLLMYDHPQMFAKGLELLFAECCQTTDLFEDLHKMEILTSAQQQVFQHIKDDVAALGKLLYSFENWGVDDHFSGDDPAQMMKLQKICLKLRSLATVGDSHSTPLEIQKMMHETEFFSHFVYAICIDKTDYPASSHPILAKVTGLVCSCASRFVSANKKNQELMFSVMENALWLLDDQPDMALLFVSIFNQNKELCEQVTHDLVDRFGGLIERERRAGKFSPWFLQFYLAITVAEGKGVVRNQVMVVDVISRRTPAATLHLLQGEAGLDRVIQLANQFTSMGQLRDIEASRWNGGADAELIYYIRSVELLVNISTGKGIHNLVNKPWVKSLFPVASLLRLLLRTSSVVSADLEPITVSVHMRLKTLWLKLLVFLLYDVDKRLVDMDVLASPLHVEFFGKMLDWAEKSLQTMRGPATDDAPMLSEEDDNFLAAMLKCIDCFFKYIYDQVKHFELCNEIVKVAQSYAKSFTPILQATATATGPMFGFRDVELLRVTSLRVVSSMNPAVAAAHEKRKDSKKSRVRSMPVAGASSEAEGQWRSMVEALEADPVIHRRIIAEEARVGQLTTMIGELTDPDHAQYVKQLPSDRKGFLPEGVDFRRVQITTEAVLARCVKHSSDHLRSDLQSMRLIQRMLLSVLVTARNCGDTQLLIKLQEKFVQSHVTNLIIQFLDSNLAEDITNKAWTLLAEVLCIGRRVGDVFVAPEEEGFSLVNKTVQQGILDVCIHGDDSGMWESFSQVIHLVSQNIRVAHSLRHLSAMTDAESNTVSDYEEYLSYAVRIMEAVRLMVEGHYYEMQEYLFSQMGNARSCNVLEAVTGLVVRLCKDPAAADNSELCEVDCLSQCLTLLMELAQGPNLRNQEFLSTMGVIENATMLLAASFERIQKQVNDVYPSPIRCLKASLLELMLSLVEGRLDTKIHKNLLQRLEVETLRQRIQFVYMYFVFGMVEVAKGNLRTTANCALPLSSSTYRLFSPAADPGSLNAEILQAKDVAEELLEDLLDDELDELFSEALNVLELVYNLCPHSKEFEQRVVPAEEDDFVDDRADFAGTDRDFEIARVAHYKKANYRLSFEFMARFVKTIEVMLNGHMQQLHFQQPLTAMWYVQETAKQRILDTIPFSAPDIKAKAFIQLCVEAHSESKHIRQLSRFSVVPARCLRLARRHLPDSAHRPFQIFLANDARMMAQLLQIALLLGLAVALHVGIFLVPKESDGEPGSHHETVFSSPLTEKVAFSMGGVYFACTGLWISLTVCIQVPLNMQSQRAKSPGMSVAKQLAMAIFLLLQDVYISWRIALLCFCSGALFCAHFWLFSFLLLDFFCQNTLLATVLKAISAPARSLMMTFLGAVIVTFVYAAVGFHWFRYEFGDYCNENILTCTQNIVYQGTRNGIIGLSSMMHTVMPDNEDWLERLVFDISYFVVYGIMILNTIVGLIVDSFGALRHEQEQRERNLDTQAFISCIDRKKIDAVAQAQGISDGFTYHETHKQNKWDYMAFIFYLRETRLQDCTGPEQVVRLLIEEGDYKWMPIGHSMMLERAAEETTGAEDALERVERKLDRISKEVGTAEDWKVLTRTVADMTATVRTRLEGLQEQVDDIIRWIRGPQVSPSSTLATRGMPTPNARQLAAARQVTSLL